MTAKLNDTIPSYLTKQQLLTVLGKPSNVKNFSTECALTEEQEKAKVQQLYFYGKTKFFVYDNKAELTFIDFRSGKFTYRTPKIRLTKATTLQDLQKAYPNSVRAAMKENGGKLVRLKPCKICDGHCLLYLENGRLVQLEWWEDC
ncbi:MAG: hypothetical protein EOO10_18490 [Chitinophagaceae bacterium]|nr:MAG: hypothetical protein EOO10_18490 [Chitinophagaceae bacterium]